MTFWIYGLNFVPVTTATAVSFAMPLFVLILAVFFLNENITLLRWSATIMGFIGVVEKRSYRTLCSILVKSCSLNKKSSEVMNNEFTREITYFMLYCQ